MQTPTVPPSGGGGAPTGGGTALPSGIGTIPSLPPSLATALASGGTLSAQVAARPQPGQLTLTVQGQTVQVQTPLPLPPGTTLAVALQNTGPPATLTLTPQQTGTAGGQAAGAQTGAVPQGATTTGQAPAGGAASQPAVVTSLTQGSVLTATVTAGAPGTGTAATSVPGGQIPTQGQPAAQAQPGAPTQGQPSAQAGAPQNQALPPGSTVQLRLLGFAPQGQSLANAGTPGTFSGTVTGQGAGGTTTVQTPLGTVSINLPNSPPPGTQLLLSAIGDPRLPPPGSGTAAGTGARFQALQDAIQLIRNGDPAAAQRLTQSLLPQPNGQLGLAAVFLANAIRQGNAERWMGGDAARALSAAGGKKTGGALGRLEGEMARAQGRATDGSGQDWRVTNLPFLSDGQVDQIRLYTRNRPEDGGGDKKGDGSPEAKRFVIEADFSRLGPVQLDGLAREKNVDLRVRTQRALEAEARDEIRALFADTVSALGLSGRVEFTVVPRFDIVPVPDEAPAEGLTV